MSCFFPRDAWKSRRLTEKGKRQVVFNRRDGYEDMSLQVPCGKCGGCKADRALAWSIRCFHEASLYPQNCFLTLTYADPAPERLDKSHLQNFFKRLRSDDVKLRYYACGEYGSQTRRPHYHASIFGADFLGSRGTVQISEELYVSDYISEVWGFGLAALSPFNMATACYVAGYVAKKIGTEDSDEFQLQSKGIGFEWLQRYWPELAANGFTVIEGRRLPIPPAYLKYAEDKLNGVLNQVKLDRKARFDSLDIERRIDLRREVAAKEVYMNQRIEHQKNKQRI